MKKRDTYKYVLKNGNGIQYIGITNDPKSREKQHRESKDFKKMEIVGNVVTRESAENWETNRLDVYRQNHGGKNPPQNKKINGK